MTYKMIGVAVVFAVSSSSMAAELAKSGAFEGRFYSHIVQKIEDLETVHGMKSYVNESDHGDDPRQILIHRPGAEARLG